VYRLHCFSQSGNCYKVALLLRALGQAYESVYIDYLGGMTRDPGWRDQANEMGEAPVLDDGPRRLTQSGAILSYLARKHDRYAGDTDDERQEVLRWLLFDNHKFTSYFATYRFSRAFGATAPDPAVMAWLKTRIDSAFTIVDKHLASRGFMIGGAATIADFSMSAYLFYPTEESGYDVHWHYPNIAAWLERMRRLPGWAPPYDVLPGERIAPRW
jgi:glutathione S-transferase